MKKTFYIVLLAAVYALVASCADHDDPKLSPIDASQVKITANVSDRPNASWMVPTKEMTISVQNLEMTAPKGVVLKSVYLVANTDLGSRLIEEKPYSGQDMEFKVPLTSMRGRINF